MNYLCEMFFPGNQGDFLLFFWLNFSLLLASWRGESLTSGARASGPLRMVPLFSVHPLCSNLTWLALNLLLSLHPQCPEMLPWPHSPSSTRAVLGNLYPLCVCKHTCLPHGEQMETHTTQQGLLYHPHHPWSTKIPSLSGQGKTSLQPPPPPPRYFTEGHSHTAQAPPSLALNKQNLLLVSIVKRRLKELKSQ